MLRIVLAVLVIGVVQSACRRGGGSASRDASAEKTAQVVSPAGPEIARKFVTARDGKFWLEGWPYYFVGANFWQGMNLGSAGQGGDRARLVRELDFLRGLGISNLRVMASSEGPNTEPCRIVPALMTAPGEYDAGVLDGLDFLLAEMGKRDLRAVMVLNNYWQWSGGMAQYVAWHEESPIPYPGDYEIFIKCSARFYSYKECQKWFRSHIEMLLNRSNSYTGHKYRDDPAVFSWEQANEPRNYPQDWIDETAAFIKSLDPNHMVTTGSEGALPGNHQDFIKTHSCSAIDYATIHIWPQNWGWYDPKTPSTYKGAEALAVAYFQEHARAASSMRKPLVLEEFGLARDWAPLGDNFNPASPTAAKDRFYAALFKLVADSVTEGGPAAGDNFWAWGGEARPGKPWVGDPPHEPAGWYSVYNSDTSTLAVISSHVREMAQRTAK